MRHTAFLAAVSVSACIALPAAAPRLPHVEEIAPGVHAAGFQHRYGSANCGWVAMADSTLLIGLPRGVAVGEFLERVRTTSRRPARQLALTHFEAGDVGILESLIEHGVARIVTSAVIATALTDATERVPRELVRAVSTHAAIGDAAMPVELIALDDVVEKGAAAIYLPRQKTLFAGPVVVNGPRAQLPGTDTAQWVSRLGELEELGAERVVPGFGSWRGRDLVGRQRRFLVELRRQIAYGIAMGRPLDVFQHEIRLPASHYVWRPYDTPRPDDLRHVYSELTVPAAPFGNKAPQKSEAVPHALVLIGDRYHEPGYIEAGLRLVFEATRVVPHFTVDVQSLSKTNLARVDLLVVLRDGMNWPEGPDRPYVVWMTPEQERDVVQFVEAGGAFLNLHNSMGLYPEDGPYLNLVGGRYIGHGPLERFRVEVVDREHPITRGVEDFSVADEQHTPPYDEERAHLLLRNRSDDGEAAAAGWVREPARGRLCHLANGHTPESLFHPQYQLLLRNAVEWCLRRDGR